MFIDVTQEPFLFGAAGFAVGWLLASIKGWLRARRKARHQDPKDSRIRALEAELRIAQKDRDNALAEFEAGKEALEAAAEGNKKRDAVIVHQQSKIDKLTADLKESVHKTRELRNELSEKATENIRSEAKLREVETELEIAQASSDLYATGVFDYESAKEADE